MLPNFICIGPGRTGTSWLYEVLLEHPQVCMAKNIKETEFFNKNYRRGVGWYKKFYEDCRGSIARGEITNRYIFDPSAPSKIKELINDCKILIGLRNPYERVLSAYVWHLREGTFPVSCSFKEALRIMPELIQENQYHSLVKPYYDLFGHEKIFTIFFEDIASRPIDLCRELFSFLGVDEQFVPNVANKKVNKSIVPKYPLVSCVTKGTAILLRRMGFYRPLTWAKKQDWLKGMLFREFDYRQKYLMTPEIRASMDSVIVPEIEKLEKLIKRNLDGWKSSVASGQDDYRHKEQHENKHMQTAL